MFDRNASYTIVFEDDKSVFLIDDDHGLSVTNDAERVCHKLLQGLGRKDKRFFYRDTDHRWEELVHSGFRFTHIRWVSDKDSMYQHFKNIISKYTF